MKATKLYWFKKLRVYKGTDCIFFEIVDGKTRLVEALWIFDEVPELTRILINYLIDEIPKTMNQLKRDLESFKKRYAELEKQVDERPELEEELKELVKEIPKLEQDIEYLQSFKDKLIEVSAGLKSLAEI